MTRLLVSLYGSMSFIWQILRDGNYRSLVYQAIKFKCINFVSTYVDGTRLEFNTNTKMYKLKFYDGPQEYWILFPKNRRPISFIVYDENQNNITDEIKKYAGPGNNFYGTDIKVKDIGYSSIHVDYFTRNKIITANQPLSEIYS